MFQPDVVQKPTTYIYFMNEQKRGDTEEAIKLYRDLLQRGEETAEIYNNLGVCYFYKEKFVMVKYDNHYQMGHQISKEFHLNFI